MSSDLYYGLGNNPLTTPTKKEELTKVEALELINILLNEGLCRKTRDRYHQLMEKYKKEVNDNT